MDWFGGVEIHYAKPPDHLHEKIPSHDHCWLLDGPCWHDGSSTHASEVWIPRWLGCRGDNELMLKMLQDEFMEQIECLK